MIREILLDNSVHTTIVVVKYSMTAMDLCVGVIISKSKCLLLSMDISNGCYYVRPYFRDVSLTLALKFVWIGVFEPS